MLSFSESKKQLELQDKFKKMWEEYPVYSYVKSQDNKWFYMKV